MDNYVSLSIETHLFFARIMKEHAIFLEAGFPCQNSQWITKADWFKEEFEELLSNVIRLAPGRVHPHILTSDELITEFTIPAEECTEKLTGISINTGISSKERKLCSQSPSSPIWNREIQQAVHRINRRSIQLLNEFIEFKESIIAEVEKANLFTANYPLLIKHILREAQLYRDTIEQIMGNGNISRKHIRGTENFWNRIMMEHAMFIRGLLDPSECELMSTACEFADDYCKLLEMAKIQDCRANEEMRNELREKSLTETIKYREFKTAGTKGILDCKISSLILPLLADHVLREANHYIRILSSHHDFRNS